MQSVNTIIYNKKDFGTDDNLYTKIAHQIQLLVETGNVIVIRGEETRSGVVYIEYSLQNPSLGQPYPYWLLPYEANYVAAYHDKIEIEKYKKIVNEIEDLEEDETEDFFITKKKKDNKGGGEA